MVNKQKTVVSIVMPTFNRAGKIGDAVKSVLNQDYKDWELLIIDNESTDNTREIIEQYVKKDSRIKYHYIKKSTLPGLAPYLNYGIKAAEGKYIARLDDDDEWYVKSKLTKQVDFLESHGDYNLVGGGAIMVDENKKELYKFFKRETDEEIRNNALYASPFWHNTVMFRKKVAAEAGGYKNLRFGEDWELWLRLGKLGKFYNFKEHFSLYSSAGDSFSVKHQKFVGKTILGIIMQYRKDYPNYRKAIILNFVQYLYSFSPLFVKRRTQNFLSFLKRNYF